LLEVFSRIICYHPDDFLNVFIPTDDNINVILQPDDNTIFHHAR
jgi:hypothetical protein